MKIRTAKKSRRQRGMSKQQPNPPCRESALRSLENHQRINEAYAILSDNVRRKEFDLVLRNELLGRVGGNTGKKSGKNSSSLRYRCLEERRTARQGGVVNKLS